MGGLQERQITLYRHSLRGLTGLRDRVEPLRAAGYRVLERLDGPLEAGRDEVVWLMSNAAFFPRVCRQLTALPRAERPFVVSWHGEPLPPSRASGYRWPLLDAREIYRILRPGARPADIYTNYFALRRLARHGLPDLLVVGTRAWQELLHERGIPAEFVHGSAFPNFGRDLGLPRDIDVLFLGDRKIRRRRRAFARLRAAGVPLEAVGEMGNPSYWGEARTQLLNRVKILLNVHRAPGELPSTRLLLGMANGAMVISEPLYLPEPFVPGVHFVSATLEEMPDAIRYYLDHPLEREQIVAQGKQLTLAEHMQPASTYGRVIEMIESRLAER